MTKLDEKFFKIWKCWNGTVSSKFYKKLINTLMEGAYANVVTQLKLRQIKKSKEAEQEIALDTVLRMLPRMIEKKKQKWEPPYGPVALTSLDVVYILFNEKQKQADRENVSFEEIQNFTQKEEEIEDE